jgi:hypothetical protein
VASQVLEEADQLPTVHAYVQVDVSLKVCESAPSVPQLYPELGVQAVLATGAPPEQKLFETVVPSLRWQVTKRVSVEEFTSAMQEPERVWRSPAPHPAVGAQGA